MKMFKPLAIGKIDFKEVVEGGYYYIDKSLLIKELFDSRAGVTLIPRPRRFGKTLNMSMLKYFFEKTGAANRHLFDGLAIAQHKDCMEHQGKYPVIFLTFKDVKAEAWSDCYDKIKMVLAAAFRQHAYLLEEGCVDQLEKKIFNGIIKEKAVQAHFEDALHFLTMLLHRFYGVRPIVLLDEYDAPIHAGFVYNYFSKVISFMRGLLCAVFKDNVHLERGVLTGILRVAKESIFSGINNLDVHTMLSPFYAEHFGFLEHEVEQMLKAYDIACSIDEVRSWYNGYAIGGTPRAVGGSSYQIKVYNPWSILKCVQNQGAFGAYWVNTSDNIIIQRLIQRATSDVKEDFELILAGKTVTRLISEDIVFPEVYANSDAIWSFLIFSGYLTWQHREVMQISCDAALIVPNNEVLDCFKKLINRSFSESLGSDTYKTMLAALAQGNVAAFEKYFQRNIVESMSFFDVTGKTPERVYHAYVLGLLVGLGATHEVKSNRESGLGCYDVCLIPYDTSKPGTIIEFKVFNGREDRDLKAAAKSALKQIDAMQYEMELRARGIQRVVKLAIIFKGKKVLVAQG